MAYKTTLVSVTKSSTKGIGASGIDGDILNAENGSISGAANEWGGIGQSSNGRYIVFVSEATNFDGLADDGDREVFFKDMVTGDLKRVNLNFNADSSSPDVSDDGRYIVYQTGETIYRQEIPATGPIPAVEIITTEGIDPQMSANGRFIVYTGTDDQIYLRDMESGESTPTLVSIDSLGNTGNLLSGDGSANAFVSNDGNYVVFQSKSDNFEDALGNSLNANANTEIYLKNIQTGDLTRISENAQGGGGITSTLIPASQNAMISANGRYVVFETSNNDFGPISNVNGTNAIGTAVYRKDLITGQLDLVSESKAGVASGAGSDASITADGRFILFKAEYVGPVNDGSLNQAANTLSPNYYSYWYVKDMANGDVYNIDIPRASVQFKTVVSTPIGVITNTTPAVYEVPFESYNAIISADGKYITLSSTQSLDKGLVPKTVITTEGANFADNNDEQFDVFRLDISSITSKAATGQTQNGSNAADTLVGGMGSDKLVGLDGDDTYVVEIIKSGTGANAIAKLKDTVVEAADKGNDSINLIGSVLDLTKSSTITLAANVEQLDASQTGATKLNLTGNALNNRIFGNDAANTLDGGTEADQLYGGKGDDTYILDNVGDEALEDVGADGIDTIKVSFTDDGAVNLNDPNYDGIDNVILTNKVAFNIYGNELDNELTGNAAANTIIGDVGNDTLDGAAGADDLIGGSGNDFYIVDNALDQVSELVDDGDDTVKSSITYTLGANLESLILTGAAAIAGTGNGLDNALTGNTGANKLFGLAGEDILIGGAGNDTLDGGTGADDMQGDAGDDTYLVDDEDDDVIEAAGATGGKDTIISSITIDALAANVENLTLAASAGNIDGFGNALANTITGNDANNQLGDESAVYGPAVDNLIGGKGDDTYHVGMLMSGTGAKTVIKIKDIVKEVAGAGSGFDTVKLHGEITEYSPGNVITVASTITLGANLEGLDIGFTGATLLNLNGNAVGNELKGNVASNKILGLAGDDTLIGDEGNDTLDGGADDDVLEGNSDDDSLIGGAGEDELFGGGGNDTYVVNLKTVTVMGVAQAQLEDTITEEDGTDTLKLTGAAKLVNATTFTLADDLADIEHIDISGTGSTKLNLVGSDLANYLTGNAATNTLTGGLGDDTLDGGLGNDTLIGGDGNDLYMVNAIGDVVTEAGEADSDDDTVQGAMSLDLANYAGVENIILSGTTAISAKGNAGDNRIEGNSAANKLEGFDGLDFLIGGAGNDTLDGGLGGDTMIGAAGDDTYIVDDELDVVNDSVSGALGGIDTVRLVDGYLGGGYLASADIEKVDASALGFGLNLFGNELANTITGTSLDDGLEGNDGNDTLIGGAGDDELIGGLGADNLQGGIGNDAYQVNLKLVGTGGNVTVALEDTITEVAGVAGGTDTLLIFGGEDATKLTTLTLAATLENLVAASVDSEIALNLTGNNSNNNIIGSNGNNVILGLTGNDTLSGADGNDSLDGGVGNDILVGGIGNDTLNGGAGADTLSGGEGDDTYLVNISKSPNGPQIIFDDVFTDEAVNGGVDTLKLSGSATLTSPANIRIGSVLENGPDHIENLDISATGSTKLNIEGSEAANRIIANAANNDIEGDDGNDTIDGGAGDDNINGGGDSDSIDGGLGNDMLDGDGDNDTLNGGAGNDSLIGGSGNDIIFGGAGKDTLSGGFDDDVFKFTAISDSAVGVNRDVITGFNFDNAQFGDPPVPEFDIIDLSEIDAITSVAGDQAFSLIGNSTFSKVAGQLRFEQILGTAPGVEPFISTHIFGDVNGDGKADFEIQVYGPVNFTVDDFML